LLVLVLVSWAELSYGCDGTPNTYPVWSGTPTFLNSTTHGKLFVAGDPYNEVSVLHLYGTPYQMGYAQGQLLGERIKTLYSNFYVYADEIAEGLPILKDLPTSIVDKIANEGLNVALEWELAETGRFIPTHFWEEMAGLADGAGIARSEVYKVHMFPELIKAQCSMFGAWGQATINSKNGGLIQLRSLDFGTDNPFRLEPMLAVYHPNKNGGNKFAHLTFSGFLGAFTGYGEKTAICEKLWDSYNGTDKRAGIPWNFALRDILQFDTTIEEGVERLTNADRTCSIFVGIGDHQSGTFNAVEYSVDILEVFNDSTPFPGFRPMSPEHPLLNDLVYIDKHVQPSGDPCMAQLLQQNYGNIDALNTINLISLFQTGDLHAAVYDFGANAMYVGVANQTGPFPPPDQSQIMPAYDRPFLRFNMTQLFSETL